MMLYTALPPNLHTEYAVVYEARAIHDTASIQLTDYQLAVGSSWIVATLSPSDASGSATVRDAYIEASTGRFVNPSDTDASLLKQGIWKTVEQGEPSTPDHGKYEWHEPLKHSIRAITPEDYYSPFAYGGTVVFQWQPTGEGAQRFAACRMIFPEWAPAVADTLKASAHIAGILAKLASPSAGTDDASQLLAGNNGLSASLTFRAWLSASNALAMHAPRLLKTADTRRLSVFVYLALSTPSATDRTPWVTAIDQLIAETSEPERLMAIAYAAFAISLFKTQNHAAVEAAHHVLSALQKRLNELGIPMTDPSRWHVIFSRSGIT